MTPREGPMTSSRLIGDEAREDLGQAIFVPAVRSARAAHEELVELEAGESPDAIALSRGWPAPDDQLERRVDIDSPPLVLGQKLVEVRF
jgi:hypothetical protein